MFNVEDYTEEDLQRLTRIAERYGMTVEDYLRECQRVVIEQAVASPAVQEWIAKRVMEMITQWAYPSYTVHLPSQWKPAIPHLPGEDK